MSERKKSYHARTSNEAAKAWRSRTKKVQVFGARVIQYWTQSRPNLQFHELPPTLNWSLNHKRVGQLTSYAIKHILNYPNRLLRIITELWWLLKCNELGVIIDGTNQGSSRSTSTGRLTKGHGNSKSKGQKSLEIHCQYKLKEPQDCFGKDWATPLSVRLSLSDFSMNGSGILLS